MAPKRFMTVTKKIGWCNWQWIVYEYDPSTTLYWKLVSGYSTTEERAKNVAFDRTPKIAYTDGNPTNEVSDND